MKQTPKETLDLLEGLNLNPFRSLDKQFRFCEIVQMKYNIAIEEQRKKELEFLQENIEWGNQQRLNNNIFRKSVDEVNEDWIERMENKIKQLEEKK